MIGSAAIRTQLKTAFRLEPFEVPELDLQAACCDVLDLLLLPPAVWASYPAGHVRLTPAQAARLTRTGLRRGMPDILVWHKRTYGIELKTRDGRLSKTRIARTRRGSPRILIGQEEMFPKLIETGAFGGIAVAQSVEEMLARLSEWGVPLRRYSEPRAGRPRPLLNE